MAIYKTITYDVKPEAIEEVEASMVEYVEAWNGSVGGNLWWTAKRQDKPGSYITVLAVTDEETDNSIVTSDWTAKFLGALYPNCIEPPTFTDLTMVATSHDVPLR